MFMKQNISDYPFFLITPVIFSLFPSGVSPPTEYSSVDLTALSHVTGAHISHNHEQSNKFNWQGSLDATIPTLNWLLLMILSSVTANYLPLFIFV